MKIRTTGMVISEWTPENDDRIEIDGEGTEVTLHLMNNVGNRTPLTLSAKSFVALLGAMQAAEDECAKLAQAAWDAAP